MDVEKMNNPPPSSGRLTPSSPEEEHAWDDQDIEKRIERGARGNEDLSRTKSGISIAETLSLPREIAFVSVICMTNFLTR